jgi:DNA-binding NtrC family response regulator
VHEAVTLPEQTLRLPVRSLSLEVLSGTDKGATHHAPSDTVTIGTAEDNELRLTDPTVSRYHLELRPSPHGIAVKDLGSTNGTWIGDVRLTDGVVPGGTRLRLGQTTLKISEAGDVDIELFGDLNLAGMRGRSAAMRRLMALVQRVSKAEAPVLVMGESGTGKELVARALHELGARAAKPFVTVDCGALAPTLVASELFGYEKGAFTGADHRHLGAFERAKGGTLFLDEIGELPASLQAALLGILERKRFRRLGGTEEVVADVRVVSATHRDLRGEVNAGRFRLDLYYRVAVVRLAVPPLRERPDDVPLLMEHFLREAGASGGIEEVFSADFRKALEGHQWPGNVRELRNVVEEALAMGEMPRLDLAPEGARPRSAPAHDGETSADLPYKEARRQLLETFEKDYLSKLMAACERNISLAARRAEMDRSHLLEMLKRHGLR